MKLNLNTILAVAGGVGVFAPDVASVSAWLAGTSVPWLGTVAKGLGVLALLLASLPRIVTRLRPVLAAANLATPPAPPAPDPRELLKVEAPEVKRKATPI